LNGDQANDLTQKRIQMNENLPHPLNERELEMLESFALSQGFEDKRKVFNDRLDLKPSSDFTILEKHDHRFIIDEKKAHFFFKDTFFKAFILFSTSTHFEVWLERDDRLTVLGCQFDNVQDMLSNLFEYVELFSFQKSSSQDKHQ
jgi:hypothetical protein